MRYFIYALQFLFITLKLVGIISWSWWLVLLPLIFIIVCNVFVLLMTGYLYTKTYSNSTEEFDKLVKKVKGYEK